MKRTVAITIDADAAAAAERLARARGVSVSALIEGLLREAASRPAASFASRWRGAFRPAERAGDARYETLARKYLA